MMTDVFRALLAKLCEIDPKRFTVFEDKEYDGELWSFHDEQHKYTLKPGDCQYATWLFALLAELKIGALWRLEGLTWEESVLNAIVHHMETQP